MAIFSASTGINQIKDESVRNYLAELNENLTYMFNNLTPDDNNASGVPKLTIVNDGTNQTVVEISADGITMTVGDVSGDNLISTINTRIALGNETIVVQSGSMTIDTSGFKLDENGNAEFAGQISSGGYNNQYGSIKIYGASGKSAGAIGSWDKNGITFGGFSVDSSGDTINFASGHGTLGEFGGNGYLHLEGSDTSAETETYINGGDITCYEIYPQSSWWDGWSLTEVCQELWEAVFGSSSSSEDEP